MMKGIKLINEVPILLPAVYSIINKKKVIRIFANLYMIFEKKE